MPESSPSAPRREALPRTGRRALLGWVSAAPTLALVAGCDGGTSAEPTEGSSTPSAPTNASASGAGTSADPDLALVVEARALLATEAAWVQRASRTHEALTEPLSGLLALHRTHDRRLAGAQPDAASATSPSAGASPSASRVPAVPGEVGAALDAVRARERTLQRALVERAGRADSGALAQLFASMSAAVAQRLQRLPTTVGVNG